MHDDLYLLDDQYVLLMKDCMDQQMKDKEREAFNWMMGHIDCDLDLNSGGIKW